MARPLLWAGLALWAVELAAWVLTLQRLPLEVAFPLMALSYAAVPLAAHLFLRERLDRRQWAGVAPDHPRRRPGGRRRRLRSAFMAAPDLAFRMEAPATASGPRRGALLIHGLTGAPAEMRYLAKRLNRDGLVVSAPLLAGHGTTPADLLATTWRDWLDGLVAAHDTLAAEVDKVHVAGICVGGLLGLALAHVRPTIASAAAYSVTLAHDGWAMPWWYAGCQAAYPIFSLPGLRAIEIPEEEPYGIKNPRLRARVANALDMAVDGALPAFPCGALVQQHRLAAHVLKVAPTVRTPVLLLHAVDNDQSRPRNAERLRDRLGGPVDLRWMHDSYHMVHVDQERAEVAAMTSRFLRGLPVVEAAAPPPRASLAAAFPLSTASYVLVVAAGALVFHEPLKPVEPAGAALILAVVGLLAPRGRP